MKKILLSFIAMSLIALSTFVSAQYGGGGGGSAFNPGISAGGSSSFVALRDNCPSGDLSPSFTDGSCVSRVTASDVNSLLVAGPNDNDEGRILDIPTSNNNGSDNNGSNGNGSNPENTNLELNNNTNINTPKALPKTGAGY